MNDDDEELLMHVAAGTSLPVALAAVGDDAEPIESGRRSSVFAVSMLVTIVTVGILWFAFRA